MSPGGRAPCKARLDVELVVVVRELHGLKSHMRRGTVARLGERPLPRIEARTEVLLLPSIKRLVHARRRAIQPKPAVISPQNLSPASRRGRGAKETFVISSNSLTWRAAVDPRSPPCEGGARLYQIRQQKSPFCGDFKSPLTDSNRRPPPYHSALRRDARASAGNRDHESPANRRDPAKTRDRAWTPVLLLVFPQCSLGLTPSLAFRRRGGPMQRGCPSEASSAGKRAAWRR
jgi:hypothetical protein